MMGIFRAIIVISVIILLCSYWFYTPLPEYTLEERWLFEAFRVSDFLGNLLVCLLFYCTQLVFVADSLDWVVNDYLWIDVRQVMNIEYSIWMSRAGWASSWVWDTRSQSSVPSSSGWSSSSLLKKTTRIFRFYVL